MAVAGDSPIRVGDVEVMHGQATVLMVLVGRWPGSVQLSPDDADAVADRLRQQAAYARRVNDDGEDATVQQGRLKHPAIYMSRATTIEVWRMLYDTEPDLRGDLRFGLAKIPVLFDDRMELGTARLEEDPDPQ